MFLIKGFVKQNGECIITFRRNRSANRQLCTTVLLTANYFCPPFVRQMGVCALNVITRYMQRQLTEFLVEIIEVPVTTWLIIWLLTAGFCGVMIAAQDQPHGLAWGWCLFGWFMKGMQVVYERHLTWTLSMCGNRKYLRRPRLAPWFSRLLPGTELQVLVKDVKPGWTSLDLPDPAMRSLWEKVLFGIAHVPNRQQLLFPFRAKGKVANEFLARLYVLSQTVYCSLLVFTFWPIMAKRHAAFGTENLVLYAVLSLYPLYSYASTLGGLVQSVS